MIGSIAKGITRIKNFPSNEDCHRTIEAFRKLGIEIRGEDEEISVYGNGLHGLKKPSNKIYLGNSGTSMRLLLGILAGQDFSCMLTGDASLTNRPMSRVTEPLEKMGAEITARIESGQAYPPLVIKGGRLKAIEYTTPIPSAQVKSALLLAGLYAEGITAVTERSESRDHTERMLELFGAEIRSENLTISLKSVSSELSSPGSLEIPGDISSAAFFLVGSALCKGSAIIIRNVGLNPTRTGIIDILRRMGAKILISAMSYQLPDASEPRGDIAVEESRLKGVEIEAEEIPRVIDELPVLMVAASCAEGVTIIRGAAELRVKETDRIHSMVSNLRKMGADIRVEQDEVIIQGGAQFQGTRVISFGDHRTAMAMAIAGLVARGETVVEDTECINTSFPGFMDTLGRLV